MTNQATRIIVKAAGDLAPERFATVDRLDTATETGSDDLEILETEKAVLAESEVSEEVDIEAYRPEVRQDRTWSLSEVDLGMWRLLSRLVDMSQA